MKTIKVSEASGSVLDWLMAKCEGYNCEFDDDVAGPWLVPQEGYLHDEKPFESYSPTSNWAQGGPILQREGISIIFHEQGHWTASNLHGTVCGEGTTPPVAAMRCYVASKLGETVEVPEELI